MGEAAPARCDRPDSESGTATAAYRCRPAESGQYLPPVNDNKAAMQIAGVGRSGRATSPKAPGLTSPASTLPTPASEVLDLPMPAPALPVGRRSRQWEAPSV